MVITPTTPDERNKPEALGTFLPGSCEGCSVAIQRRPCDRHLLKWVDQVTGGAPRNSAASVNILQPRHEIRAEVYHTGELCREAASVWGFRT